MTVALNAAGEVITLQGGEWKPAPTAKNEKGDMLFLDGDQWSPVPGKSAAQTDPAGSMSVNNLGRSVARGVPILGGFADEIAAGGDAATQPLLGRGSQAGTFGERYDQNLATERGRDRAFDVQNPAASTVAKIGGGVLGTVGALRAAPASIGTPAATLPGRIGQAGAIGGAIGAGHGFGEGEGGLGNRALESLKGAGLGTGIGMVGQPLAEGLVAGGRGIYRGLTGTGPTPQDNARAALAAALQRDKTTPAMMDVRQAADRAGGLEPTLADLSGENVHMLGKLTGRLPGAGRDEMRKFALARNDESRAAFWDNLLGAFNPMNATDLKGTVATRLAKIGEDAYQPLFAAKPTVKTTDAVEKFFDTPLGASYMEGGLKNLANNTSANVQALGPAGATGIVRGTYYMEALHNIRSSMLGDLRALKIAGKEHTPEGRNIARGAEDLSGVLKTNKDYAAASRDYADEKAIERAINNGGKLFTVRPDELKAFLAKATPGEREGYMAGAFDAIEKTARGNGDAAASFLNRPEMQDRLRSIFGDVAAQKLVANLQRTSQYRATGEAMNPRGGSPTMPLMAEAADQNPTMAGVTSMLSGRPGDATAQFANAAGTVGGGAALGAGVAGYNSGFDPYAMLKGAAVGGVAGGVAGQRHNIGANLRGLNEPARAELARLLTMTAPNARNVLGANKAQIDQQMLADILMQRTVRDLGAGSIPAMEMSGR